MSIYCYFFHLRLERRIDGPGYQLDEASTHGSAKTHAGNFLYLVTLTFDNWTPKIHGFPGIIVEHFVYQVWYVGF